MSAKVSKELNQRSNQFFCVFNDSGADLFKSSRFIYSKMLKEIPNLRFIALIFHENEWDSDLKKIKTNHYHVYFNLKDCLMTSLNNMLNTIVDIFKCNRNQISIEKATDECKCVRYLIHLDDLDKQSYLPFDIVTNNESLCAEYFARIPIINDIKEVVEIARRYHYSTEQIMLAIGKKNWKNWRTEFLDLKRDNLRL